MDVTDFLPNGFNLRQGKGGGDPKNGLCFMETVALIAGEKITDQPECACPILTAYGIGMNDRFADKDRQRLLPLAWATAGTRSKEHAFIRRKILGIAACDIVEMVLPIFEKKYPKDARPRQAIDAAIAYWAAPGIETLAKVKAAASAAYAADAAYAAYAAYAASAAYAADAASAIRRQIIERQFVALREAILAGPNGGIPGEIVKARIEKVADLLPVNA